MGSNSGFITCSLRGFGLFTHHLHVSGSFPGQEDKWVSAFLGVL